MEPCLTALLPYLHLDALGLVGEGAIILQQCQFYEAMERADSEGESIG